MPFDPVNYEGQDRLQHIEKYVNTHDASLSGGRFSLRDRSLRNTWKKLSSASLASSAPYPHLKWLTAGDSMSQDMSQYYLPWIERMSGGFAGAYFSGNYRGTTTNATTGTVTGNTADFDAWYSGITDQFAAGATRTYGVGGSTFVCNQIKVYYVKGPASTKDGGDFTVQVDGVNQTSVSTTSSSISLGIVTLTPALAAHNMTVVCNTGPIRIVGVGFENTGIKGLVTMNGSQAGIALNSPTTAAWNNYTTFLADTLPDVITYEAKEDSSYFAGSLVTFFGAIKAGTTACDVIAIGSSPVGPTVYSGKGDAEQVVQNSILQTAAQNAGFYYWDGYTPLGDWTTVNALGWGSDQTHLSTVAHQYRAKQFAQDFGIDYFQGQASPLDVAPANAQIVSQETFGKTKATPVATYDSDNQFDQDLNSWFKRWWRVFADSTKATEYVRFDFSTALGTNGFFNQWIGLGSGNAGLKGDSSTQVRVCTTAAGTTPANLLLGSVVQQQVTQTNVSGAITCNLASGGYHEVVLNGNMTSFAFSNPGTNGQEITLAVIQDVSGSHTAAGWSASIKWAAATAPTLTVTGSRRDIFRFIQVSGSYYEVSRSMAVG